ncbi:FCS-Like Zinc finger 17-like [Dendrobium catenatum]|nr:FCS-Like Zinc finger 17-like [Dendrobium catenatum]
MLPRTRSIFHLEEERERELNAINGVSVREAREGKLVGLRILIQQHQGKKSNVVIKSSVKPWKKPEALGCHFLSENFLKSCFLCKKELSLQKEVYMYRGDQGFCSVECRYKQILHDERREFDSTKRERIEVSSQHIRSSKVQTSSRRTKISVVT